MRVCENGVYRDATQEEMQENGEEVVVLDEPSVEERLAALEAAMLEQILGVR